jgi:hypothetical protein
VASPLPNIPVELMNPRQKYTLIFFLEGLTLPPHIARGILQAWGEAVGVELTAGDYQLLDHRLGRTPGTAGL